jgi:CRISPR/Cas system CSM-associated protein Csm5 (group 7 of RAMP superfamily)
MSKNRKKYRLQFTPLTPIHIGTGDEIDPLEYKMITKEDRSVRLYRLNLPKMVESFTPPQREEFLHLLDSGDMVKLRKFVDTNTDTAQHAFYNAVVNEPVYETYRRKLSDPNNALRINPAYRRLDTWQAVIPGSSIKGAIRTAVLSKELRDAYEPKSWLPDTRRWNWENEVLFSTKPNDDPFRTVHLEDVTLPEDAIIVAETEIISRNPSKAVSETGGIQQFYEMTFAHLMQEEIAGSGCLTLLTGLRREHDNRNPPQNKMLDIDIETIAACCTEFYRKRMEEEHDSFYRKRRGETVHSVSEQLLDVSYSKMEFPIRLGHFSHCESMTVDLIQKNGDPLRNPKTRRGKDGRPLPYGTTRTLAFGEFPMGWAKISLEEM